MKQRTPKMHLKGRSSAIVLLFALLLAGCTTPTDPHREHPGNLPPEAMQWWEDAKFGMFIHWGPYAMFEGEWNGRQVPVGENSEWVMQKLEIPAVEYRKVAAGFNPVKFDAGEWTNLARETGMKYLVITAKHHDGFAMYDSEVSDYNIVDYTPYGRDVLKELSMACADRDIRFCFYYSHREDWDHPYAYGNYWDFETSQQNGYEYEPEKPFTTYLEEKAKPQMVELLTGYGPIGLVWFDRGMYTREQGLEFLNLVREHQPGCLVNGRVGNYNLDLIGDYQNMSDNGMPPGGVEEYWETPQTLNETWGYSRFDTRWKDPTEVIHRLAEIVSKGGNYLLNIGPKGDGSIPQASVDILKEVGAWMSVNGESIYGTTASPLPYQDWGFCTVKGNVLYLHVLDWPADGVLEVGGLKSRVTAASLLDGGKEVGLDREGNTHLISLPPEAPDPRNTVIKLELAGSPQADPAIIMAAAGDTILLDMVTALTSGKSVKRFNRKGQFFISKWTSPSDQASWLLELEEPGSYRASVTYSTPEGSEGSGFVLEGGEELLEGILEETGEPFEFGTFNIGKLSFTGPGRHEIRFRPATEVEADLMFLKSIRLVGITDSSE